MSKTNKKLIIDSQIKLREIYAFSEYTHVEFNLPSTSSITIPDLMFTQSCVLKSVVFKNFVANVGEEAFSHCSELGEVIFEQGVRKICKDAFANLPLTKVEFTSDVTIEEGAFDNCGYAGQMLTIVVPFECKKIHAFTQKSGIGYHIKESHANIIHASEYPLVIKARDFNVKIKNKKILTGVNIDIHPGEMIMVIGGSGTGKSTLIKNLFGLEPSDNIISVTCDTKLAKGKPHSRKVQKLLKKHVFYAPQFTISNDNLTVKQEIQKNALMFRKEGKYSERELKELTSSFKLDGKVLETMVGKISGGQKKKLLMACSKSSNPQIYVFDEPDSGLDEPSAFSLFIRHLRKDEVNQKGKTVIVISHHPHNFMSDFNSSTSNRTPFEDIFTRLIVLAKINDDEGGTIAFDGAPLGARKFFGLNNNDPYSRIVSKVMTEQEGGESSRIDIQRFIDKYKRNYKRT